MRSLVLRLRTPRGLVIDRQVDGIVAEDASGWFGVRPGCEDLIAVLPPGLLLFRDRDGEQFVALSGGLLHLTGTECRVMVPEAVVSTELEAIADELARQARRRRAQAETHRGVLADLAREAMRRLVRREEAS